MNAAEAHSPTGPMDDARLAERLRAGDAAAFDELVESAAGRMLSVARRMLHTEQDAEDAVQEAFLNAFRSIGRFDGRSKLTTWLHQITVNACLMKLRTRRRRPERSIESLLPAFLDAGHQASPAAGWREGGAEADESEQVRGLVRASLEELPDAYRTVLVLRDAEGLDTDETAAVLGITPEAVRTRLHRARQALKTLLDPHFAGSQS
jgi:RNA polymerase sigma-70 factor (ECF subfamily)